MQKGVTLLETLITIGTIGVLSSIFLSALPSVKKQYGINLCQLNQVQLYDAIVSRNLTYENEIIGRGNTELEFKLYEEFCGPWRYDEYLGEPFVRLELLNCPTMKEQERTATPLFRNLSILSSGRVSGYLVNNYWLSRDMFHLGEGEDIIKPRLIVSEPFGEEMHERIESFTIDGKDYSVTSVPNMLHSGRQGKKHGGVFTYSDRHSKWETDPETDE